MKLKNKVILFITGMFTVAVALMAFKTWINYKNIIDFEDKIVEKNIQNLVDTIALSHEKLNKTIDLYQFDLVGLNEMITKDEYKLRDNFIRDDFTHMFLLDENKSIVKSIVYFQELQIFTENEKFLENYNKPLKVDEIYFGTYDFEKIFFTIRKLDNSFDGIKYIALGKALNSNFLSLVTRLTENYISFEPGYDSSNNEKKTIYFKDKIFNYTVDRVSDDRLVSYLELHDNINDENFYLSMESKRSVFTNIVKNNTNIFYFISILLLIIIVSLYYFISRYFTNRIENISNTIKKATKNKELKTTIEVEYDDEITYLAKKINAMFITIDHKHYEEIEKQRDFLQSILDAQESIILITDGSGIKSTNQKFNQHFNSHESFLKNIAILDDGVKDNFLEIIKNYSSFNHPAKIKVSDEHEGYFVFDIKKIDIKNYVVSINDISDINQTLCKLNEKASFDELTKVYNKGSIICITKDWLTKKSFALGVIDIDFFKKINDTYGHSVGDYILRDVSKLIQSNIDKNDILGRFGGEEFILLINEENKDHIVSICERLREKIQSQVFIYDDLHINITISLGVTLSKNKMNFEELFNEADKYLYEAKETGRNKVCYNFYSN